MADAMFGAVPAAQLSPVEGKRRPVGSAPGNREGPLRRRGAVKDRRRFA
jgi:hypothetical protein